LLDNISHPKINYVNWAAAALFVCGFVMGKMSLLRSGIAVSCAGLGLFLFTKYYVQDPEEQLKIEAEKSKRIYRDILEMLAEFYIRKANFVFEKVQREIQEKQLQDIHAIFNTVKKHVDAYDTLKSEFENPEDVLNCLFHHRLKPHAIKLITGAKEIGPCLDFMSLSTFCWEFAYGVGINPHADWAPTGDMKRYFLCMTPSEDLTCWTVQKFQPHILKPF